MRAPFDSSSDKNHRAVFEKDSTLLRAANMGSDAAFHGKTALQSSDESKLACFDVHSSLVSTRKPVVTS